MKNLMERLLSGNSGDKTWVALCAEAAEEIARLERRLAGMRGRRLIVTSNDRPPIPTRAHDWCAFRDGEEEKGGYGYGVTELEAVADLLQNEED